MKRIEKYFNTRERWYRLGWCVRPYRYWHRRTRTNQTKIANEAILKTNEAILKTNEVILRARGGSKDLR
eukprot:1402369-Pyramimonas_sp.AAC.1